MKAPLSHPSRDLMARDEEGNTALHIAASSGHHDVVEELMGLATRMNQHDSQFTKISEREQASVNKHTSPALQDCILTYCVFKQCWKHTKHQKKGKLSVIKSVRHGWNTTSITIPAYTTRHVRPHKTYMYLACARSSAPQGSGYRVPGRGYGCTGGTVTVRYHSNSVDAL